MQLYGLNILDFLLIFILFIGAIVGFIRGVGPQLMSLASIWLSLLITLWTYKLLSVNIFLESEFFGATSSDAMAFLILFIVYFHSIRLLVKYLTKPPEEKKKKPRRKGTVGFVAEAKPTPIKRFVISPMLAITSMFLGVVLTILWLAIILGVMQFFFQVDVGEVTGVAVPGQGLVNQLNTSASIIYFNQVLWLLVQSLDFFVLDAKADILKQVVCSVFPDSC